MKKILLFAITLFYINCCFAQKLVERKNKVTDFVNETYQTVIETNKQVKQGVYRAFFDKKTLVAMGTYTDDKRTGTWHFFSREGTQLENYNYDLNKLTYEAPEDASSNIRYLVDLAINDTDRVSKPVRPGGRYFGYVPYLRVFKLPPEMETSNRDSYDVVLELLVSPGGRLADYKIHIRYPRNETDLVVLNINTNLIPEEDKMFVPATFNYKPISARVMIRCYTTKFDGIEMY